MRQKTFGKGRRPEPVNSKRIRKLAAGAIGFLVLLYVGYQFYALQNKGVSTETVM